MRELDRQIEGALFQRVALSRDTRKLAAIERKKGPAELVRYEDVFKDPYVLDFLGLKGAYSEKDLEAALVRNIEDFLAELGTDFCFIARQFPMRIDDIDHSLDLLFYHRGLRCRPCPGPARCGSHSLWRCLACSFASRVTSPAGSSSCL